ncbi:putative death-receptor fusion protein (DUF2428) domain-containing protein [Ditylenchus destructor]|uniref:tRNA (32-2'-O)-methyltransferase regulator THADA n=1 Tax=Ditylenchus destructor TaxID=166010 RepID=A0AAD4N125_9BILA|nr:putative death-receptor fusion protein (DUF2428) domain-containing protein [Ditylenchus destructor]
MYLGPNGICLNMDGLSIKEDMEKKRKRIWMKKRPQKSDPNWIKPCCENHSCFLVDFALPSLLNQCKGKTNEVRLVYDVAHNIRRLLTVLREENFRIDDSAESAILDFALQYADFVLEVVTYTCFDIFSALLHLHRIRCTICGQNSSEMPKYECSWIQEMASKNLFNTEILSSGRISILHRLIGECQDGWRLLNRNIFERFYENIGNPTLGTAISSLICKDISESAERHSFHTEMIRNCMLSESSETRAAISQRLLLKILKNPQIRNWLFEKYSLLSDFPPSSKYALDAQLTLARFAMINQKAVSLSHKTWADFIPKSTLLMGLVSNIADTKLASWQLISEHPKSSQPLTKIELDFARLFIGSNMTEQNSSVRQKIVAGLSKILERLRDSSKSMTKKITENDNKEMLGNYKEFLSYLTGLAFYSLSPKSNFNRRLTALQIIKTMFCPVTSKGANLDDQLEKVFKISEWITQTNYESILRCFDDDYGACQQLALEILVQMEVPQKNINISAFVSNTKSKLFAFKASTHAQFSLNFRLRFIGQKYAEIGSELFSKIFQKAEDRLPRNGIQIPLEVSELGPIYSILSSTEALVASFIENERENYETSRQFLDNDMWQTRVKRLADVCFQMADVVTPVVHNLSPEGFMPECLAKKEGSDQVVFASQRLSVCCWRTHKTISSMFGLLVSKLPFPHALDCDTLRRIVDYLWLQLTECRHCGAFGRAAEAFEVVCRRLDRLRNLSPVNWLEQALDALAGKKDTQKLCSTRRSAGLPHLVTAILSTQPGANKGVSSPELDQTLDQLLQCRTSGSSELEIHCVNVMKALFSNGSLSSALMTRVEAAFSVCLRGCASSIWPVRNAHCQLFAVLIKKIFGAPKAVQRSFHVQQKCKMSSWVFFSRYPSLYPVLQESLENYDRSSSTDFTIFPCLIVLSHIFPSIQTSDEAKLSSFLPKLLRILFLSASKNVRELSAAAIVSIALPFELEKILASVARQIELLKILDENFTDAVLTLVSFSHELGLLNQPTMISPALSILNSLLQSSIFLNVSDFNRASLLLLASRVGVEHLENLICQSTATLLSETPECLSSTCIHSLRPLCGFLAKCQVNVWEKIEHSFTEDSVFRYEFYRAIFLLGVPILDEILQMAISDLKECKNETYLRYILQLLIRESANIRRDFDHENQDIVAYLRAELYTAKFVRDPWNQLNLRRLCFYIHDFKGIVDAETNFIRESLQHPDENIRLNTLKLVEEIFQSNGDDTFFKLATLALKDECVEIRHYASRITGQKLMDAKWDELELNTEICWSLATERYPELAQEINEENGLAHDEDGADSDEEDGVLFEDCARNPFAEPFGIYDFKNTFKDGLLELCNFLLTALINS